MVNDINHYINECETCQNNKYERNSQQIKHQLIETPSGPFEKPHIDIFFIVEQYFLSLIDAFYKYGQVYELENKTALSVLKKLQIFTSHLWYPKSITSDLEEEFYINDLKEFCTPHKIELHFTTAKN